ncbi:MAG: hypothetical protein U0V87_01765 [Acidobacteriota bacterium]
MASFEDAAALVDDNDFRRLRCLIESAIDGVPLPRRNGNRIPDEASVQTSG